MLPTLSIKNHEIDEHFFLREINFALFISSGYFDFRGSKFLNLTIFEIVKSVVEVHSIVRKFRTFSVIQILREIYDRKIT